MFFVLGFAAALLKSNLTIPEPAVRFLSLYLMLAIGFKGGVSLYHSSLFGDGLIMIAIILAVIMAQCAGKTKSAKSTRLVIRESLTDGILLVLVGSMGIGYLLTAMGTESSPLAAFISGDMFTGMLVFFLLYMGTVVGRKVRELDHFPPALAAFAIIAPIANGMAAIGLSWLFGFERGDALPEANPAKYLTMSMGITFPLNIVIGIPGYWWIIERIL